MLFSGETHSRRQKKEEKTQLPSFWVLSDSLFPLHLAAVLVLVIKLHLSQTIHILAQESLEIEMTWNKCLQDMN